MRRAEIKRGRHGSFDLFIEDDDSLLIRKGQYASAIEAEVDATKMGASTARDGGREAKKMEARRTG